MPNDVRHLPHFNPVEFTFEERNTCFVLAVDNGMAMDLRQQEFDHEPVERFVKQIGSGIDSVVPILQAIQQHYRYLPDASLGIEIPTLCYLKGYEPSTSCQVCLVKDRQRNQLLPSCATRILADMQIDSQSDEVHVMRRTALELLFSDHVGDCLAPCYFACPAHMDIPLMLQQIDERQVEAAIATVKREIALPAVLGRVCSKPCEKGCRRKAADDAVAVCGDNLLRCPNPNSPAALVHCSRMRRIDWQKALGMRCVICPNREWNTRLNRPRIRRIAVFPAVALATVPASSNVSRSNITPIRIGLAAHGEPWK